MKYTQLKEKEVVDAGNGCRIGYVVDLKIDPQQGKILEVLVVSSRKCKELFKKPPLIRIPFRNIIQIGPDIILVKLG